MIAAVTVMFVPSPAAQAAGTTVVDPNTTGTWENFTNPGGVTSTQNVGRIWTDKSVFNGNYTFGGSEDLSGKTVNKAYDSDFLVSLSALSSTSNLKTTTTTTTPLDIVLVVDTSGSMDNGQGDSMGSVTTYEQIYGQNLSSSRTYYVLVDGEYVAVEAHGNYWNRYWESDDGTRYTPIQDRWDDDRSHVQFYQRVTQNVNKMEALQNAANTFVDSVAALNDDITDSKQQHRISLVKFASDESNTIGNGFNQQRYNNSQVVSDLTAYTSATSSTLKNTINNLYGEGATRADYGLHQAQRVLTGEGDTTGARSNAKKIVIFFTDGNPTSGSSWEGDVAARAINYAYDIKATGAQIYSIGVFQDANPNDTYGNFNRYMNAVSSNYKDAQCGAPSREWVQTGDWPWQGEWVEGEFEQNENFSDLDLGNRTPGAEGEPSPDYYFAASDAEQLNQVFDDITSSITEGLGSGSPIEETTSTSQGNTNPGNLTFEDQLGSYMQVTGTGAGTDKIQLAYGNQIYTSESKTTEGNTDTYHFAKQTVGGNEVYGEANLADIVVTVERSTNLSVGDKITVTLPASLLPMRHYDVDTDNSTMNVDKAYPVRLFYGVTLKTDAKKALDDASGDTYQDILNDVEVSEDGTLDFYSNAFAENVASGLTTATFTPSEGNKFYYYTENTPLYVDESCQTRATNGNIGSYSTVYYADTYWKTENGTTSETTTGVAVERNGFDFSKIQYDRQGRAYIPAHTQRADRPSTLVSNKDDFKEGNATGTASSVLVPSWNDDGTVSQALGNNGKLLYPAPGDLEIKKEVDWGNASDDTKTSKNTFTFQVSLNDSTGAALTGTYNYAVYGAGADPVRTGTISNNGTVSITPDERVLITGLPAGATYTVIEQGANSNGFATTDSSTGENANTTDGKVEGTIVGGSQQSVTFKNTYNAAPVNLNTKATLRVQKNLTGRDWRATDEFTFEIDGLVNASTGETAPEPEQTTVTVTDETPDYTAAFGDITFTKPGEYRYAITEHNDINPIDGIDYSAARYRAIVTVTDNGTGKLVVDSVTIEQRLNDDGVTPEQQPTITNNTVVFTNNYDVDNGTTNIDGTKNYTDTTGGNPINADKFAFQLKAVGGFDTATGSEGGYTIDAADVPMPAGADENQAVTTTNTGFGFGFPTISYDGNDVGKTFVYEVTELAGTETGMSYDATTTHTVQVVVTETDDPENPDQTIIVATPNMTPEEVVFNNTYDPTDAKLEGEDAIHGTKTLTGRDMLEGETFYFQLTQTGGPATVDPDDGDAYVTVLQNPETATVSADDGDMAFNFSDLTFPQTGEYTFTVNEVAADGTEATDGSGLTYDKNICTVTVNVTDNKQGVLVADVTYTNQGHDETDQAVFTNTYKASMDYGTAGAGGIKVTKQILDRTMAKGDYTFTITGEGEAADLVTAADASFTNTAAAVDGTVTMDKLQSLKFDQDDAGKTFTFTVDEADPAEGQAIAGVAYDKSQYKVEIEVVDNGNGTMHTVTTVTKTMDSNGDVANDVVVDRANSDADGYTVPSFGFVNDYNPGSVTIGEDAGHPIQVTKTVAGAPSPADVNYSFTLKLTSDNKAGISEGLTQEGDAWVAHVSTNGVINQDTEDGTQDDSQTVTFDDITFTEPGTYTFEVAEDAPAADDGWTFDTAAKTVTVVVSDLNQDNQYDGDLHIASVTGSPVQVTNRYDPESVVVGGEGAQQQITVKKSVTGADSTADFAFDIAAVDEDDPKWNNVEAVETPYNSQTTITDGVTQAESKTATFGAIKFNAAGTYQFTVTENGAAEFNKGNDRKGWTYDEHAVTVTVTVEDTDYDGHLEATVSYDNSKATTDADKAEQNAAAFTNAYTTTPAELTKGADSGIGVQKQVTGAPNSANFGFTAIFNADASAEKATEADLLTGVATGIEGLTDGKLSVTINEDFEAGDTKAADFDTIKLTKPGVYVFDVTEDNAKSEAPNGWTYDTATHQIVVTVRDNGQGQLVASVEGNDPLFTNSYHAGSIALDGDDQLKVTKKVTGAPALSDFEFTLKLTGGDATGVTGLDQNNSITKSTSDLFGKEGDEAVQTVEFGALTFTKAGTYEFQVVENTTTDAAGWTYASGEDNAQTITVTVTDDQFSGQLEATTKVDGKDTNNPTFTNRYKAGSITTGEDGFAELQVTKNVTGAPATEEFTFELAPAKDYGDKVEGLGDDGKLTVSTTDLEGQEDSRTLTFGDLTFNEEGTYTFNIKETNADPKDGSGWTYDNDDAKQITVVVTDENHDGKLDATTVVDGQDTNNPTFTNAYVPAEVTTDADADTAIQVTKKVTGHDAIEAFEFSLSLKDGQNAGAVFEGKGEDKTTFDGMTVTTSKDIKAGKTEAKTFGDITFTEAGDYVFVIDETTTTTAGGWTYDGSTHEVTVHVKDNSEGELYIDGIDGNKPTFENVYQLQPAKFRAARFQLQGNKVLDGRNWETGDEFTFTLTAGRGDNVDGSQMSEDEVAATMPDSTSDTIRPADGDGSKVTDNSAQFTFTDERFPGEDIVGNEDDVFTYTKPGTYRYLIRETNPNVSNPGSGILGVSYDQTVYRLTVKVTDNGDGTMNAEGSYTRRNADGTWADLTGSNEVTFTNKYSSDEIDVTFNAFKVLEDRDQNMEDGEFTFHMEFAGWAANDANADPDDDSDWTMDDTTDAPKAAEDTGNIIRGDVTFGEMAFTKDNVGYTYRYKITENAGTVPGVTYDKSVHYVTAKVTSVSTPDDPQDPDGAYTEHVRVETSGEAEWNEQNGTAPTSGAIFTNTYEAGAATGVPADFQLTKQFTGHEWTDDYVFEFTLAAQDSELADGTPVDVADVPMPVNATKTVNAPDEKDGDTATFDFGSISYDKAGTYRYTVTETHAGETLDGITYDAQPAQVTVTVTEGKDPTGALTGQLVATATVTNGDFVNTYETSAVYNATGVGGLDITKQVTNHAMTDGQFSFTITAAGDNADAAAEKLGIEDGTTTTVESAQAEAGVATSVKDNPFETVTFDKSDDGVTYTYTITENGKTGEGDYKNYVLDDSTYTVQIKPVDNGDGTMTVTTQVSDGAGYTEMTTDQRATVPFVNSYQADPTTVGAEGAATIEGTKTLKNDILADGQFTFQVKNGDVVVATGTNAANGTITFDDITYTTENLAAAATPEGSPEVGKTAGAPQVTDKGTVYTFNYTVSEVEPAADSGVTASTAAQNITVTVTDDGNGTLTPVVTYGDGDPLAFENVYGGDAEFPLDIAGTKQIVGAQDGLNVPVLKADDYEFTIVGNPAQDGTPAPMPAVTTVANDASGNVTFEDIVYTMENTFGHASATGVATLTAGRTQVFTYTISESGSVDGVTNEQGTKTVEVTVTDLGGGKLEAEVTSVKTDEGADFAFTNVYDVNPTTSSLTGKSGFEITKKLTSDTGRKLAKDEFSFQLTSGDTVVATASNDADGTVSFDGIEFTKPGTYDYVLSEVNDGKPGVDYDATSYNVTATAEDQGNGTLKVTWEMPQAVDGAVTFANVYDPADATVTLGAGKTFAGADLKDAQFTFQLTGADESTPMPEGAKDGVSTATNDENGSIVFGTIAYDKPGTYKYTVSEVNDEQDGVTYDDTTYEVTVTVTDDTATGTLKAAVSYGDADAMVFSNQYKKPVEPAKPTIPKTGIDVIIPGVAGLVLLLGAGGVYAFKRRRRS